MFRDIGLGSSIKCDVLGCANLRGRPLSPAVLDGIDLVQKELAQGVRTVSGFGKAECWIRPHAVVACAVAKAVAEDPLLGATRSDAEMETAAIRVEARLLERANLADVELMKLAHLSLSVSKFSA
jgi:hypothetical protein